MTAPDRRRTASSVAQIALLSGLPASLSAGAWTSSFPGPRWSERSLASLLVRRVLAAPAAEFAHLDPVGRVSPRLVGLVVTPFAVSACQRHCDADISASHSNPRLFYAPLQDKTPGRGARLRARIASCDGRRRGQKAPGTLCPWIYDGPRSCSIASVPGSKARSPRSRAKAQKRATSATSPETRSPRTSTRTSSTPAASGT